MKKIYLLPLIILSVVAFFFSCQKDYPAITPTSAIVHDTIIVRDTIRIHDTFCPPQLTKPQLLVQKVWRLDYLHHVINGIFSSYNRGGANTTGINYDSFRFKFETGGTGTVTDQVNNTYPLLWQFTTTDYRTLQITVNGRTDTWRMVELTGNYLHSSTNINIPGDPNNIETHRLIQIP
jgi:hypothetical protein